METPPFVHLHCHSHYSLLDGASSIDGLIGRVKEAGMNALALTDHGNLYGSLEFYEKARKAGINPILGYEAYIAPQSRFHKEADGMKEAAYHLTLLAQNQTGFRNLSRLSSKAFLEGFYYKPRIDKEILKEYSEGIICLSGCVSGEFSSALVRGQEPNLEKAMETAKWFQSIFGDRYFIEIQNNGLQIQQAAMAGAVEIANRMGMPLVATSDAHYLRQGDAEAQDVMLCINTGKFRADAKRMKMDGDQFYVRSPKEMHDYFPGHEEALKRSQEIADSCNIQLELGKRHFPVFTPPEQKTPTEYLRELCIKGLKERYVRDSERLIDGELAQVVIDRLDRELRVIEKLGFPNYFLIVWDFVNYAKTNGIEATARGSGVGALVAFALYLSHVCPLKYDLLFERFLDESRKEPPDIDIDFDKERRGEVIDYVKRTYGEANVSQICTFGTLAARAAIRDVGRVLGLPLARVDQVVASVPEELGIELDEAIQKSDELRKLYETDAEVRELLDLAKKIEGLARNVGTHAAAVVIADKPLIEYVPLQFGSGGKDEVITQWAMADVERAGLLKMDFLGLRNLTLLSKAVKLIEKCRGEKVDPYAFPLDDKATFALLCRGETKGVFQLESGGIRDLLTRMKPDHFRDIIATNALYRPGPLEGGMVDEYIEVKHGRQPAVYKHPVMKEVLEETHGVMVYQEQVMRILNLLGGIELPNAYSCIKAISKKKLEMIAKFKGQFIEGAQSRGMAGPTADELFSMIEKFAGYGFNKSHSTAYALIAYMTAYLKAHYSVEFMAALLTSDIEGRSFKKKDSLVEHIEDCKRMHIEVVAPDVNRSEREFTVVDGKIVFALQAIKGCGEAACQALVEERQKKGPFRSLTEFCERIGTSAVGKAMMENLIKAGAFDSLGGRRAQFSAGLEKAVQAGAGAQADRRSGQKSLFGAMQESAPEVVKATDRLPDVPDWPEKEKLAYEKEVLGYYLTSHPLAEYENTFSTYCSHFTNKLGDLKHKDPVLMAGMIASIKFSHTKNPRPGSTATKYAMWDLEDKEGMIRCILWPEQFAQCGEHVVADAILAVRGVVDKRPGSEEVNLIIDELIPLPELERRFTKRILIRYQEREQPAGTLDRLYEVLRFYPGDYELQLLLVLENGARVHMGCEKFTVSLDAEMRERVDGLLGAGNLKLIGAPPSRAPRNQNGYGDRNGNGNGRKFSQKNN